jgi:arginine repressor
MFTILCSVVMVDQLFILKAAPGAQYVTRVVRQMFGKGVFGLLCQRDAIYQEQHAGDGVRLE